jgi:hypothetical protein
MRLKDRIQWAATMGDGMYIYHCRIPSESRYCKDVFYDIVFELYPANKSDLKSTSLLTYGLRAFSNYITFQFSFTYAFNKNGLIIPWLAHKCSSEALNTPAYKTNKAAIVQPDIKMWFAMKHFYRLRLYSKNVFENAINTTPANIQRICLTQRQVLLLRGETEKAARDKEKTDIKYRRNQRTRERLVEAGVSGAVKKEILKYNSTHDNPIPSSNMQKKIVLEVRKAREARMPKGIIHARAAKRAKKSR